KLLDGINAHGKRISIVTRRNNDISVSRTKARRVVSHRFKVPSPPYVICGEGRNQVSCKLTATCCQTCN
ncbi:hypothetical protein L9F63_015433, partial [Diploptera punctata]